MQIIIRARNVDLDELLRSYVDRRLRFALGRFGGRVHRVKVRFDDANGARGGVDKQCSVEVSLRNGGLVLIEDLDADLHTVVDRAADRAGRAVRRELERRRNMAR